MLTYLDQARREADDLRWQLALVDLLAVCDRLSLSAEAARRFALAASAEQVQDRTAELERWGRRAA